MTKEYVNLQSYLQDKGTDKEKTVYFCGYRENDEYKEDENRYDTAAEALNALT
jgi:hypothetical protein